MELHAQQIEKCTFFSNTLITLCIRAKDNVSYFQNKQKLYNKTRKYQEKLSPQKNPLEKFENSFLNHLCIKDEIKTGILIRKNREDYILKPCGNQPNSNI